MVFDNFKLFKVILQSLNYTPCMIAFWASPKLGKIMKTFTSSTFKKIVDLYENIFIFSWLFVFSLLLYEPPLSSRILSRGKII